MARPLARGRAKERTSAPKQTTKHIMQDYLSQTEKLALCPVSEFVTIRDDEESAPKLSAKRRRLHALCAKPSGWTMPSRARCGIVSIMPSSATDTDEGESEADDQEQEQEQEREYAAHVLPSARNRRAVYAELKGMGYAWGE